jgi:subtilisin family serine protease
MKASRLALAAGMATACSALGAASSSDDAARFVARPGVIEFSGTMIAKPRAGLSDADRNAAIDRLLPLLNRQYPEVDEFVIRVPGADGTGLAENVLSQELMATGFFQYVEPNWICYPTVIPNDPQYGSQWHLPVIGAPETWDITTGTSNIVIAFTDTGVDIGHPDLAAHRLPGYNAVVELPETSGGQVNDLNGHGTHVAGIACAIGNNGQGVAGATWDTRFMMIRVSDSSSGGSSIEVLTRAARWAAENGAHSVSTSYTGINSTSIDTTGDYIRGLGKLYLYAADNSATNHSTFDWLNVIIVGATDVGDTRASFSSFGRAVDIFAPGVNILSTCNGSGYCNLSGTSMATPLANGVIGAVLSANPALTADMVEQIISETAVDLGPPGNDDAWGWGRVNMLAAVQQAVALSGPLAPFATDDNAGHKITGVSATLDVLSNDFDLNQGDSIILDTFEGTTALGGTVVRSVGTGPGGRDQLIYSAPNVAGSDSFSYTVRDTTDRTDGATVSITVVDSSFFRDPDAGPGGEPGLETAYYDGSFVFLPNFGTLTPYLTEITPAMNYPRLGRQLRGLGPGGQRRRHLRGVHRYPGDRPLHDLSRLG